MHAIKEYNWLQVKMPKKMLGDFLRILNDRGYLFNVDNDPSHEYFLISQDEGYLSSRPIKVNGIPFKEYDQDLADAYSIIPTDEAKFIFVMTLGDECVV